MSPSAQLTKEEIEMTKKTHGTPAGAMLAGSLLLALAGCGGGGSGVEASGDGTMPEMPVAGDWTIDRDTARSLIEGQDVQFSADEIVTASTNGSRPPIR